MLYALAIEDHYVGLALIHDVDEEPSCHSPTKREERKQYYGSIPERVPGKQGEIPRTQWSVHCKTCQLPSSGSGAWLGQGEEDI